MLRLPLPIFQVILVAGVLSDKGFLSNSSKLYFTFFAVIYYIVLNIFIGHLQWECVTISAKKYLS